MAKSSQSTTYLSSHLQHGTDILMQQVEHVILMHLKRTSKNWQAMQQMLLVIPVPEKACRPGKRTKSSYCRMGNWWKSSYEKTLKLLALLILEEWRLRELGSAAYKYMGVNIKEAGGLLRRKNEYKVITKKWSLKTKRLLGTASTWDISSVMLSLSTWHVRWHVVTCTAGISVQLGAGGSPGVQNQPGYL